MLPLLLAGAATGLLKSKLVDEPAANAQRKLAATTAELSPWTGMTPEMPQEANAFGSMLQGGLAGAQLGQGLQAQAANDKLMQGIAGGGAKTAAAAAPTIVPKAGAMDMAGGKTSMSADYLKMPEANMSPKRNTLQGSMSSWFGF